MMNCKYNISIRAALLMALFLVLPVLTMFASETQSDSIVSDAKNPGGKYIFIPDSLENDVIRLLMGHSMVVDDDNNLDLTEQTIHRGDTIPMVLKSRNFGRYDRGLSNMLYVPKGQWAIGITASYGEFKSQDLDLFGVLSNLDINASGYSVKPYFQYFVRNNMAVGLRFGYTNLTGGIENLTAGIGDDMNFDIHDVSYRQEDYTAAFTFSQYIGLTRHGRFGVYNEVELAFSSGNSDFTRLYDGRPVTTYTTTMEAQLNFSPGVQVFIMKNVSFHVSFGVFGFYLKNAKQREDDVEIANRFTSGANFRFNIFNINFGIAVHL